MPKQFKTNGDDFICLMPVECLREVKTLTIADEGGFQRPLNTKKVSEIADRIEDHPWCRFPPALLALVDGVYYDIDGQHRRRGHIRARQPMLAHVLVCDLQDARKNFLLHNSTSTRVSATIQLAAANNLTAQSMKKMMVRFSISETQLRSFIGGLNVGLGSMRNSLNYIDDDVDLPPALKLKAQRTLLLWTKGKYWQRRPKGDRKPEKIPTGFFYSAPGILRTLGKLIQDYDMNLEDVVKVLQVPRHWHKGSRINRIYGDGYDSIKRSLAWMQERLKPAGIIPDDLLVRVATKKAKKAKKKKKKKTRKKTR